MHLKYTEHNLREITNFDNKILMYAEILDLCVIWGKKGYVLQGLRTF